MDASRERDYFFDNFRFILIFLVVLAHFISPLSHIYQMKVLYRWIYLFHMPGMLFITGYFAKASIKEGKLVKNKVFNFFIIYAIFQTIFTLLNRGTFSIYQSQNGLWYLQLIVIYSLMLPVLSRVKTLPMLIISIVLGLLVGLDASAGHVGSLQRLLVFLPFYMAGYYSTRENLKKLFKLRYVLIGVLVLILIGYLQYKYFSIFSYSLNLSTGRYAYKAMKLKYTTGIIARFCWYIISFAMIFALMTIKKKKKNIFSKFGGRTLPVFLLHLLLIIVIRKYTDFFVLLRDLPELWASIIIVGIAIFVTLIFSLKIFSYPFDFIMKLKFKYLLKGEDKND